MHIMAGQAAADNLKNAFELDENLRGEILVFNDQLAFGPIMMEEGQTFDELRTAYLQILNPESQENMQEDAALKTWIERAVAEEEPVCFWLSPCAMDVCAYYRILPYFKDYPGMLHIIAISGLPFLNEKGQLFYPNSFAQIPAREFIKTKRLLREVTPSEFETDGDEWARLCAENTWVRTYEGGKKIISREVSHYDAQIQAVIGTEFQKASKILNESLKKTALQHGEAFLSWRIRTLAISGQFQTQGDLNKGLKDFEVKKIGAEITEAAPVME